MKGSRTENITNPKHYPCPNPKINLNLHPTPNLNPHLELCFQSSYRSELA